MGLDDREQGLLMYLAFILPSFSAWAALSFPLNSTGVAILAGGVIGGTIAFLKEQFGLAPTPTTAK